MELLSKVESVNNNIASPKKIQTVKTPQAPQAPTPISPAASEIPPTPTASDEEAYVVHQINTLSEEGIYKGSAAGGVFIEAFLEKLKSKNKPVTSLVNSLFKNLDQPLQQSSVNQSPPSPDAFPTPVSIASPLSASPASTTAPILTLPSRLTSDRLTATYFHEWNSMFAILDQYAYLEEYQNVMSLLSTAEATNNYDALKGKETFMVTALLVVYLGSIATKDKSAQAMAESNKLEQEWKKAFTHQLQSKPTLATVQALVLALIASMHVGNSNDVAWYRMLAINTTQRLGLHRCHKSLKMHNGEQLPFYEQEMRRRLFWVTYTLDCFAAAQLGSPRLLNDEDIECALPSNIDDDMLRSASDSPSEGDNKMTQMSCPLSIIHFSKCLANILRTIYSSVKKTHPYKTVVQLEDQLESWRRELPTDLKFDFANGQPSATLSPVHQKSPLHLMFYHYARILIHLPALSSISSGTRGSASCVAVMQSAKLLIQVSNYLKHRAVISTIPMNPSRMNVFFAALVMYGAVDYSKGGALLMDVRKTIQSLQSHIFADIQIRRPGSLSQESFHLFEQVCDGLLSGSGPQGSSGRSGRKSSVSSVSSSFEDKKSVLSTVSRRSNSASIPMSSPSASTTSVTTTSTNLQSNESLREAAINDLLFLNSLATSASSAPTAAATPAPTPNSSEIHKPIDLFDFVRPGLVGDELFLSFTDEHTSPASSTTMGKTSLGDLAFGSGISDKHSTGDLLEFLWDEPTSASMS